MTNQQRELRRLGFNVMKSLWKLHGYLAWLLERNQFGDPPSAEDVDAFYSRYYDLHDAVDAFRRSTLWRSVDDDDSSEAEVAD